MYHHIIFYRSEPPSLSPAVSIWWPGKVIDLFNMLPPSVWGAGSMPEGMCVRFIGGCFSVPEIDTQRMEVWTLALRFDRLKEWERVNGTRVFGEPWLRWLSEEIAAWEKPPVLVDAESNEASQGGKRLCHWKANPLDPEKPLWVELAE